MKPRMGYYYKIQNEVLKEILIVKVIGKRTAKIICINKSDSSYEKGEIIGIAPDDNFEKLTKDEVRMEML